MTSLTALLRRFVKEDAGQDLIEYALLASFIGLVGVLAYRTIGTTMQGVYQGWDQATQDKWEVSDPAGS